MFSPKWGEVTNNATVEPSPRLLFLYVEALPFNL